MFKLQGTCGSYIRDTNHQSHLMEQDMRLTFHAFSIIELGTVVLVDMVRINVGHGMDHGMGAINHELDLVSYIG